MFFIIFGSLTIFALFPSDDEVIRRERPSRRMASPPDETNKVSFAKIVKEPNFLKKKGSLTNPAKELK